MAILAYDDVMLREPRLLVPGKPPIGECKINQDSALFKRLRPTFVFGPQRRAYWPIDKPVMFSSLNGGRFGGTPAGKAMCANGGTSDGFVTDKNADFLSGAVALSAYFLIFDSGTTGNILGRWATALNYGGFIVTWSSNKLSIAVAPGNNAEFWSFRKTATSGVGLNPLGVTWDGSKNPDTMDLYLNGKLDNGDWIFNANCNAIQTVSSPLYICKTGDTGDGSGNAKVLFGAIAIGRLWSADDHAAIAADPFEIVTPA